MALTFVCRFRDSLHGSIPATEIEMAVIDHPAFQRLRRIKQTAFLALAFPGASHTRFEHSLGVMHLAGVAWEKLGSNIRRLESTCRIVPDFKNREMEGQPDGTLWPVFDVIDRLFTSDYIIQAIRMAGLVHDTGHPPFSHTGEMFLGTWSQLASGSPQFQDFIAKHGLASWFSKKDPNGRVSHEVYTLLTVAHIFEEMDQSSGLQLRDVLSVLDPSIEPEPDSPLAPLRAHVLLHEILSSEVDVDRMDYLLRDSKACGVAYGGYDLDRILDSLVIYHSNMDGNFHIGLKYGGLAAFEDYLRARHSMYWQLYYHKCSVAGEAMLRFVRRHLDGWILPLDLRDYLEIDDHGFYDVLRRQVGAQGGSDEIVAMLKDLFRDRRLWKRCFEITTNTQVAQEDPQPIVGFLEEHGIPYERISSRVALSRIATEAKPSHIRLVKKDPGFVPRVVAVADYSKALSQGLDLEIKRIYIPEPAFRIHFKNLLDSGKIGKT